MSKNILIFAPMGDYLVHHQLDAVIGKSLELRGCNVKVLLCDQLFEQCYIAGRPFDPQRCAGCSKRGLELFGSLQLETIQLRSLLSTEQMQNARSWADSLPTNELYSAEHDGDAIGMWMRFSMHAYFRSSELDYTDPEIESTNRNFLYNGRLIRDACLRFFESFTPDYAFCYQGAHSYYRVCYELCRERNIDVMIHERGLREDTFQLLKNTTTYEMSNRVPEEWKEWKKTPLSKEQWEKSHKLLSRRENNEGTNFQKMLRAPTEDVDVRRILRIPAKAPLVVLFTSGDWEIGMHRSYGTLQLTFKDQEEWMRETAALCEELGIYYVIRHHPLGAGTGAYPRANRFLGSLYRLNLDLGRFGRVVMPAEKLNSYSLIWNADAVITQCSTTNSDALLRGLRSLCVAECFYTQMGLEWIQDKESYRNEIRKMADGISLISKEVLRQAYRYVYFLNYVSLAHVFKSFGIHEIYHPNIRVKRLDELLPGNDPVLDRVCDHIMTGSSLYEEPQFLEANQIAEDEIIDREYDAILKRRATLQEEISNRDFVASKSVVDVLHLKQDSSAFGHDRTIRSLGRSRHREFRAHACDLSEVNTLEGLIANVSQLKSDFCSLVLDGSYIDEARISTSVDALTSEQGSSSIAAISGLYSVNSIGDVEEELFTELVRAPSYVEACKIVPAITNPLAVLSLAVFRTADLLLFLQELQAQSAGDLAEKIYNKFFLERGSYHLLNAPMVVFYQDSSV